MPTLPFHPVRALRIQWKKERGFRQIRKAGVWFIDIPRTSSTSLKVQLADAFGFAYAKRSSRYAGAAALFEDHMPASSLVHLLGRKRWDGLFTFTIVRNPWDRAVSIYRFRRNVTKDVPSTMDFKQYIAQLDRPSYTFAAPSSPYSFHGYYYQAADYLLDGKGEMLVDWVGRFERREEDLAYLSERTGVPFDVALKAEPGGPQCSYLSFYDEESRDIVARHAWKDIELFGYEFGT